ncbi:MAG: hypothetical protein IAA97_02370 [Spirochaetes bacterium]|uniref:Uncharacterized protein n=1 Tax=Candidatus Ornithospirochaeta stercoripullorum TaxID=2840899 RepID=A0A9D9DZB4_9SPIO|nr:hypothetical protein [Candidatus Ornithospirochaeta stercoripullorum]
MFGYVMANASTLSKEEKEIYKAHYCGLCKILREQYGQKAIMVLSYDMVFLEMVLADIADADEEKGKERCLPHPVKEHEYIITKYTRYASDMQMLLGYYSLLDKVRDEGKGKSEEKKMRVLLPELEKKYPRISTTLKNGLKTIEDNEEKNIKDPEEMALLFGKILGEVFVYDDTSFFRDDLRSLGCGLGRFIYLLDAWCDRKKDRKEGAYNPLSDDITEDEIKEMLLDAAAAASAAFERLPLDQHVFILRNILYSGIWSKFREDKK